MGRTLKIPLYWRELFRHLSHEEIGQIVTYCLEYADGKWPRQLVLRADAAIVLDRCVEDVKYQMSHKRAYKKPEDSSEIRNSEEYKVWRACVFERDHYACQNCGQVGGTLNAHHIKPFSKYPEFRLDVNNGITLCKKCHKLAHRKGRK